MVSGSEVYTVRIAIKAASPTVWKALCEDCAGSIDSLVELLQGRFSKGVMERACLAGKGLFPTPEDITLSCSCPDWTDMCKHVAAVLYGVGAPRRQPRTTVRLAGRGSHGVGGERGRGARSGKEAHSQQACYGRGRFGRSLRRGDGGNRRPRGR